MSGNGEKWIEIEIDWDTGKIIAVEGYPDPVECKAEIMELGEDMIDIYEGGWTIEIHIQNQMQNSENDQSKGKKKTTN